MDNKTWDSLKADQRVMQADSGLGTISSVSHFTEYDGVWGIYVKWDHIAEIRQIVYTSPAMKSIELAVDALAVYESLRTSDA